MKKGLIGTIVVACSIGVMLLLLSARICHVFPEVGGWMKTGCWLSERLSAEPADPLIHHSQANTWHHRIEAQYEQASLAYAEAAALKEEIDRVRLERQRLEDLRGSMSCELKKSAVQVLRNSPQEEVLEPLEAIALDAPCLEVRKEAIYAIEQFGSEEAQRALERIIIQLNRR